MNEVSPKRSKSIKNNQQLMKNQTEWQQRINLLIKINPKLREIFNLVDQDFAQLFVGISEFQKNGQNLSEQIKNSFFKRNYVKIIVNFFQYMFDFHLKSLKFQEKCETFIPFTEWLQNQVKFFLPNHIIFLKKKKLQKQKEFQQIKQSIKQYQNQYQQLNTQQSHKENNLNLKRTISERKQQDKERKQIQKIQSPIRKKEQSKSIIQDKQEKEIKSSGGSSSETIYKDQQQQQIKLKNKNKNQNESEDELDYEYIIENKKVIKKKISSSQNIIQQKQQINIVNRKSEYKLKQSFKKTSQKIINKPTQNVNKNIQQQNQSKQAQLLSSKLIQKQDLSLKKNSQKQSQLIRLQNILQTQTQQNKQSKQTPNKKDKKDKQINSLKTRLVAILRYPQKRFYIMPEMAPITNEMKQKQPTRRSKQGIKRKYNKRSTNNYKQKYMKSQQQKQKRFQ